jgi:hypothetical protein
MRAFNVLKKVELQSEESRQREKVTGLVAYLLELEKEERIKRKIESGEIIDVVPTDTVSDRNVQLDNNDHLKMALHSLTGTNTEEDEEEIEEGLLDSLP